MDRRRLYRMCPISVTTKLEGSNPTSSNSTPTSSFQKPEFQNRDTKASNKIDQENVLTFGQCSSERKVDEEQDDEVYDGNSHSTWSHDSNTIQNHESEKFENSEEVKFVSDNIKTLESVVEIMEDSIKKDRFKTDYFIVDAKKHLEMAVKNLDDYKSFITKKPDEEKISEAISSLSLEEFGSTSSESKPLQLSDPSPEVVLEKQTVEVVSPTLEGENSEGFFPRSYFESIKKTLSECDPQNSISFMDQLPAVTPTSFISNASPQNRQIPESKTSVETSDALQKKKKKNRKKKEAVQAADETKQEDSRTDSQKILKQNDAVNLNPSFEPQEIQKFDELEFFTFCLPRFKEALRSFEALLSFEKESHYELIVKANRMLREIMKNLEKSLKALSNENVASSEPTSSDSASVNSESTPTTPLHSAQTVPLANVPGFFYSWSCTFSEAKTVIGKIMEEHFDPKSAHLKSVKNIVRELGRLVNVLKSSGFVFSATIECARKWIRQQLPPETTVFMDPVSDGMSKWLIDWQVDASLLFSKVLECQLSPIGSMQLHRKFHRMYNWLTFSPSIQQSILQMHNVPFVFPVPGNVVNTQTVPTPTAPPASTVTKTKGSKAKGSKKKPPEKTESQKKISSVCAYIERCNDWYKDEEDSLFKVIWR